MHRSGKAGSYHFHNHTHHPGEKDLLLGPEMTSSIGLPANGYTLEFVAEHIKG
jgi:hypothetical protein